MSNLEVSAVGKSNNSKESDDVQEPEFKPLTREEAQALRERSPQVSPWRMIAIQAAAGFVAALLAAVITSKASAGWSAGYGALAVIIPGAVFARGLTSRLSSVNAGAAMLAFFFWEAVKIALTVAMLFAAPKVVTDLSWPALLVGLVITMKAIWMSLLTSKGSANQSQVVDKN